MIEANAISKDQIDKKYNFSKSPILVPNLVNFATLNILGWGH